MADELKNLKDGLTTRLQTIAGLQVLDQSTQQVNQFPAAVILTDPLDYEEVMGGANNLRGVFRVTLFVNSADAVGAWEALDEFLAPVGTSSIAAAVRADRTLGGNADWADLKRAENIRRRELPGGDYVGADFLVHWYRSVA